MLKIVKLWRVALCLKFIDVCTHALVLLLQSPQSTEFSNLCPHSQIL